MPYHADILWTPRHYAACVNMFSLDLTVPPPSAHDHLTRRRLDFPCNQELEMPCRLQIVESETLMCLEEYQRRAIWKEVRTTEIKEDVMQYRSCVEPGVNART